MSDKLKPLYRLEDARYSEEASQFDAEIMVAIRPIFKDWVERGYNPRELSHSAQSAITELELMTVMGYSGGPCQQYREELQKKHEERLEKIKVKKAERENNKNDRT